MKMRRGLSERKLPVNLSLLLVVVLSLFVSGRASAQVVGATLSGTVTDPSGAFVPKVQVSIKHVATGIVREATTDSNGLYLAPNLAPGEYQFTTSAPGFSTLVRSGITLTVGAQQLSPLPDREDKQRGN